MATQKKIYLTVSSVVILTVLAVTLVIIPLIKGIQKSSYDFILQKANMASLEAKTKNLDKISSAYLDVEGNLKEIDKLFVDPEVPVEFIGFLEKTSKDSQVKTKISLTSYEKTEKDAWPFVTFQINVEGASLNVSRFLEKIENAPYLSEIQNITLNQPGTEILANLLLKVYAK